MPTKTKMTSLLSARQNSSPTGFIPAGAALKEIC